MTPWIGIIGTLLGAALGGWFALANSRIREKSETSRERRRLLLSKLEELFVLLEKYKFSLGTDVRLVSCTQEARR